MFLSDNLNSNNILIKWSFHHRQKAVAFKRKTKIRFKNKMKVSYYNLNTFLNLLNLSFFTMFFFFYDSLWNSAKYICSIWSHYLFFSCALKNPHYHAIKLLFGPKGPLFLSLNCIIRIVQFFTLLFDCLMISVIIYKKLSEFTIHLFGIK